MMILGTPEKPICHHPLQVPQKDSLICCFCFRFWVLNRAASKFRESIPCSKQNKDRRLSWFWYGGKVYLSQNVLSSGLSPQICSQACENWKRIWDKEKFLPSQAGGEPYGGAVGRGRGKFRCAKGWCKVDCWPIGTGGPDGSWRKVRFAVVGACEGRGKRKHTLWCCLLVFRTEESWADSWQWDWDQPLRWDWFFNIKGRMYIILW